MSTNKGRIGIIYPADGVLDYEFWRCAPPGVSVHITRQPIALAADLKIDLNQQLLVMAESSDIEWAAKTFSPVELDCVSYACTAVSFIRGVGYDAEIIRRIQMASGSPASTTTTAVVAALQEIGVSKLSVVAPYVDQVCKKLKIYFEESGFEIVNMINLDMSDGMAIGEVPAEKVFDLGVEVDIPEAQALFISCTALPTLEILDDLEDHIGKPVVSANQATMWNALKIAGAYSKLDGVGQLYRI